LRDEMMTFAPFARNPAASISPMPRDPPVITTVLPATENRLLKSMLILIFLSFSQSL